MLRCRAVTWKSGCIQSANAPSPRAFFLNAWHGTAPPLVSSSNARCGLPSTPTGAHGTISDACAMPGGSLQSCLQRPLAARRSIATVQVATKALRDPERGGTLSCRRQRIGYAGPSPAAASDSSKLTTKSSPRCPSRRSRDRADHLSAVEAQCSINRTSGRFASPPANDPGTGQIGNPATAHHPWCGSLQRWC